MKCIERVLQAIKLDEKCADDLAVNLFISRATARAMLERLRSEGRAHRKFFHNRRTNRPDYLYCAVRFPSRYRPATDGSHVKRLLGDWDATGSLDLAELLDHKQQKRRSAKVRRYA